MLHPIAPRAVWNDAVGAHHCSGCWVDRTAWDAYDSMLGLGIVINLVITIDGQIVNSVRTHAIECLQSIIIDNMVSG